MGKFFPLLALILAFAASLRAAAPNVLLIVSDDQGWGDVSWRGSPARTPNLDQLRREGTELLRFYASCVCSPTRASLFTGRSAVQLGIRDQFAPNDPGLSLLEHLMPETFRAAGYQTALTGKWHLGSTTAERRPLARGFDRFYGFLGPAVDFYTHVFTGPAGGVDWQRDGVTLNETGYATDLIAAEEIRLLRTRDTTKPFLHVVTFNAPHTPYSAPDELKANYPTLTGDAQTYAAMLESLDLNIGRILAELAALGLANDTLVIFVSDNGGAGGGGAGAGPPPRATPRSAWPRATSTTAASASPRSCAGPASCAPARRASSSSPRRIFFPRSPPPSASRRATACPSTA
jgi:arylsulfatase A-like enzyme